MKSPGIACEGLETRRLLSAAIQVQDGTLVVRGTGHADQIEISQIPPGGATPIDQTFFPEGQAAPSLYVTINGRTRRLDSRNIRNVRVQAGKGDDRVQMADDPFYTGARLAVLTFVQTLPATLLGGAGNDTLIGGQGADSLSGGAGNDLLAGFVGDDTLDGDLGRDPSRATQVMTSSAAATVTTKSSPTTPVTPCWAAAVSISSSPRTAARRPGRGSKPPRPLRHSTNCPTSATPAASSPSTGRAAPTRSSSLPLPSALVSSASASMAGRSPASTPRRSTRSSSGLTPGTYNVHAGIGGPNVPLSPNLGPLIVPIEVDGDQGNDTIVGGDRGDMLNGGDGDDQIDGGQGDDVINGGTGNDTLRGDNGNDAIVGRDGDDSIDGGAGDDTVIGDAGNDLIFGSVGVDTFESPTDSPAEWKDKHANDIIQAAPPQIVLA